jgi:hypothetical protein
MSEPYEMHPIANMTSEERETAARNVELAGMWVTEYLRRKSEHLRVCHPDEAPDACPVFCQGEDEAQMVHELSQMPGPVVIVLSVALRYAFEMDRQAKLSNLVNGGP